MAQRVSFEERCRIEALGREGSWSVAEIAVHVGRSEPTIRREFRRCGGRGFYAAGSAQADADRSPQGYVRSPRRRSIRPVMTVWRLGVFRRVPGRCFPAADPVAAVNRPNATNWVTSEG